jgi:uncharacterized protein (TIGR02453 family)
VAFTGFGDATFRFLRDLERHNDKKWFDAHRSTYEDDLLEPAMAFIEAIGPLLAKFSPGVRAEPKVGGSMMRIYRDIRFSKDKRPYKDHLDMIFRVGAAKTSPGYWFRLRADELLLGAGMHMLDKPELERFREAVGDDRTGGELATIVAKQERAGFELGGEHYKRVPAGFAASHPREALLRHAGVTVGTSMEVPAEARTSKFPAFCVARYKKMAPMIDWLSTNVA